MLVLAGGIAALIIAWAIVGFLEDPLGAMTIVPPKLRGGEEMAEALVRFFGALVLSLFIEDELGRRLRWVSAGFFVLGLGYLAFGYVEPLAVGGAADLDEELYEGLLVRTVAAVLFVVALVTRVPPRFTRWTMAVILALLVGAYIIFIWILDGETLPPLVNGNLDQATVIGSVSLVWLTSWHHVLSALPLTLSVVAVAGAIWQSRRGVMRGWLLIAMVVWAGSLLHEYEHPSIYDSEVLTSADMLHLAFAAVIIVGGVLELRRIAAERAALFTTEHERSQRMKELAILKADFSDMVAHELGSPLSAIRRLSEMMEIEDLDPRTRSSALAIMGGEIDALDTLVSDVRTAAAIERDDFQVALRPVPLIALLTNAKASAGSLLPNHQFDIFMNGSLGDHDLVMADPGRIGQVLRNLLSNAAKYSPEDMPVELRVSRGRGRVLVEIVDHGPGIHPEDLPLIFEKFGRGRDPKGRKIAGVGLGLYLSRRIVRSHGSAMFVTSRPGEGSVFGFELELAK